MLTLFLSFCLSLAVTLLIVRSANAHGHLFGDNDMSGPQKFHARPVPRIGGVGIVAGLSVVVVMQWARGLDPQGLSVGLLGCALPALLSGLAEDITKTQSPRRRLFFTAMSAALAAIFLGAVIVRSEIPGLDWLLSMTVPAILLTMFAVTGVANAVNIVDGFNGLAAMCVAMMLLAVTFVAFQTHDHVIAICGLAGLGAVLGFFVLNYPGGLVFLGDGGAYFLGFYVAELGVLLLSRNPDVSPLCPLLICIYPIFETIFSIYRRKFVRGRPVGMPDGVHLHSLIYRRLVRLAVGDRTAKVLTKRNSLTSPYLWVLCIGSVVPAMIFWNNTAILGGFILVFAATYVILYGRIVRFKSPNWLIVRR
jgi:UDP-N-acetylmuramyl pentapeptide phosphotransferase/UDP-N-acetylglucosamine-1-phosphate transferase